MAEKHCPACDEIADPAPEGTTTVMDIESQNVQYQIVGYCQECDAWLVQE